MDERILLGAIQNVVPFGIVVKRVYSNWFTEQSFKWMLRSFQVAFALVTSVE